MVAFLLSSASPFHESPPLPSCQEKKLLLLCAPCWGRGVPGELRKVLFRKKTLLGPGKGRAGPGGRWRWHWSEQRKEQGAVTHGVDLGVLNVLDVPFNKEPPPAPSSLPYPGLCFCPPLGFPVKVSLKKFNLIPDGLKGRNTSGAHSGIRDTWVQTLALKFCDLDNWAFLNLFFLL